MKTSTGWRPGPLALVGGGRRARDFLEALGARGALGLVLGVAEPEESAPGRRFAQEKGLSVSADFRDLYGLPGLETIIEVTGEDAVLEELLRTRPPEVEVIDHTRAGLIARGLSERAAPPPRPRTLTLFAQQILEAVDDGLALVNRDLRVVAANRAMRRMVRGRPADVCWLGKKRPCKECLVRRAFESGQPQRKVLRAQDGRWIEVHAYPLKSGRGVPGLAVEVCRDVTERVLAGEALEESEEKYRSLVENSPDCIKFLDLEGRYLDINTPGVEALGRPREEILGSEYAADYDPADRPAVREAVGRAARGEVVNLEAKASPDLPRSIFWFTTMVPLRDARGRVDRLLCVARDITERVRAEQELRQSQAMLQLVLDNIPQSVFWKDRDSVYLGCNRQFAREAGVGEPAEIAGKTDYELAWRREEADAFRRDDRRVMDNDTPQYHIIEPQLQAGGRQAWLDTTKVPLHDAEGRVVGVLGTYENITGRREAEQALAESEERYRLLVENSPDCIKLLDLEGRFLSINRAGIAALRRPLEQILGHEYAQDLDPADQPAVREAIRKAARGEVTTVGARSAPDAPPRIDWLVTFAPLRGAGGRVDRLLGVARDVTKLRQAEEAMTAAAREAERLSRLKDEFLSMASHELKTPVTSIKLYAEMAARPPEQVEAKLPEMMATINRQANHLVSLVTDLLDVSRLELGQVRLELAPLDLHDLVAEICAMSEDLYPDHPLRCRVPPEPLFVRADRSRLVQVLQNLIDNAAKYSPPGSPIDITIEELPGQVLISVRDYGQGISAEDLPHVFERFFKSRRQQAVVPGLGLGLYISRELVARHGGRLTAASQEGQGSTFRLELPRLPSGLPI